MKKQLKFLSLLSVMSWIGALNVYAQEWTLSSQSLISFDIKSLGISVVNGKFTQVQSKMNFQISDFKQASTEFILNVESVEINRSSLKKKILGKDLFYVEKYKTIVFKSTHFKKIEKNKYYIYGMLTIRGVTKPVIFETILKPDDQNSEKLDVLATTIIKRSDFGMQPAVAGIGENVNIQVKGVWVSNE